MRVTNGLSFDPATYMLCMGIFGITMGSISFSFAASFPPKIGGLFAWGVAMTSCGVAFLLFMLRGMADPFLTYYLANSLTIVSTTFGALTFMKFYGEFHFKPFVYILSGISLVSLAGHHFIYGEDFNTFRIVAVSSAASGFMGLCSYLVIKNQRGRFGVSAIITSVTFGIFSAVLGYRALNVIFGQASTSQLYSGSKLQFTFFVTASLVVVAASIGFILLATERLIQEAHEQTLKAQNANKLAALGEMASGVAHEINNPLAVIRLSLGYLQMNLRSELGANTKIDAIFVKLFKSVDRVAWIVRGLTIFSKQKESESFEIESIRKIIDNTLDLCEAKFSLKDIRIVVDIPETIKVSCRPTQISQIFFNLFSNCYKALHGAEVSEKIISVQGEVKGDSVYVSFTDSGPGVSAKDKLKLFQPFFTTREVGSGTGLGLSIALGIAKQHGGDLFLDETHQKTTFTLRIPLTQTGESAVTGKAS